MLFTTVSTAIYFWVLAVLVLACGYTDHITVIAAEDAKTNDEYIEPEVHRYTNVLPRHACQRLIELGEEAGFPLEHDSIDEGVEGRPNTYSQAINVISEKGTILYPQIFRVLRPYLPKIAGLIRNQRNEELDRILFPDEPPNRMPKLGWIFFRKYSPQSPRNSLKPHYDTNMHTVNIALNDDYSGGGLFYVKPAKAINPDYFPTQENNYFRGKDQDGTPDLYPFQYTYEWANSRRDGNTSDVVFPQLDTGDALIHNFTVWHAVAPIHTGVRYSMVLFFDMHNPCLPPDDDDDDDDNNDDDVDLMRIVLKHEIRECDATTGKVVYIQDKIDVYWVNFKEDEAMELVVAGLSPGTADWQITSLPGHMFRALRSVPDGEVTPPPEARDVLATVVIKPGQARYEFVSSFTTQDDCDIIADPPMEENEL